MNLLLIALLPMFISTNAFGQSGISTEKLVQGFTRPGDPLVIRTTAGVGSVLVLTSPGIEHEIHELSDLDGLVTIRTPEEALEYVRLQTSPLTHRLLRSSFVLEVLRRSDLAPGICFGDREFATALGNTSNGEWAVLDDATFARAGIEKAIAVRDGRAFRVSRTLLVEDVLGRWHLTRVVEQVDASGADVVLEMRPVRTRVPIDWSIPGIY